MSSRPYCVHSRSIDSPVLHPIHPCRTALERKESGTILINACLYEDGFDLITAKSWKCTVCIFPDEGCINPYSQKPPVFSPEVFAAVLQSG